MPTVRFTATLARHRPTPSVTVGGQTLREALDGAFRDDGLLRSYVLDEQGRLRKHVTIYIDGDVVSDRVRLTDPVGERSEIYVLQALSGG
jgi:hypothetical protein